MFFPSENMEILLELKLVSVVSFSRKEKQEPHPHGFVL